MREMIVIMMLLMGIWMLMQRGLAVPVHARTMHKLMQSRGGKQRTGIRCVKRSRMPVHDRTGHKPKQGRWKSDTPRLAVARVP